MLPNLLANNSQSNINLAATQVAQLAPRAFVIVTNEANSPSPGKTKQVVLSLPPSPCSPLSTVCGCVMCNEVAIEFSSCLSDDSICLVCASIGLTRMQQAGLVGRRSMGRRGAWLGWLIVYYIQFNCNLLTFLQSHLHKSITNERISPWLMINNSLFHYRSVQ